MALNRKYATLPDLDSAPDIYETPDLIDDNSTVPTGTIRSHSSSSSYKDFDEDEDDSNGISRSRLHPDEARSLFSPAQVDARDVDFSDRVNGKRKSYKASSRRQQKREDGTEVLGDLSDDEDGESLDRKLARLRREIEEVREDLARRKFEKSQTTGKAAGEEGPPGDDEAATLSKMLDSISVNPPGTKYSTATKLAKSLGTSSGGYGSAPVTAASQKDGEPATYTITYAPDFEQSHTLAKAADFDSRLTFLEKALGINSTVAPTIDANGTPIAVLPNLERIQRQLSVLTEASPSSLDGISRRVRTLTQEAEKLDEARKSAKVAQDELRAGKGDAAVKTGNGEEVDDPEQVAKINALYGTLGTIESLAPILPSLLDRLRSLRAIHADAAMASETLNGVARRQEDMAAEIKKWREGLEKVEEAMKQNEHVMGGNMKVVEGWVKDLEERVGRL